MSRKVLFSVMVLFALSCVLVSCHKDSETSALKQAEDCSLTDEMLEFSSQIELEDAIRNTEKASITTPITRSRSKNFTSLYDALVEEKLSHLDKEAIEEITREGLIYEPEDDFLGSTAFSLFLNQKREIKVEGKIYRYVPNGVFIYSNSQLSTLVDQVDISPFDSMANGDEIVLEEGIIFHRIEYAKTVVSAETRASSLSPVGGFTLDNGAYIPADRIHATLYEEEGGDAGKFRRWVASLGSNVSVLSINEFDSKHRMTLRVYSQDFVIYKGTGMAVRFQQKVLGVWFRKKTDEIRYGSVGPLCKYTYKDPRALLSDIIIKPAPKSYYSKPVVFFEVTVPYLKNLSISNQDIQKLLGDALKNNQTTISRFLNNNPSLDKNPRGVFATENPRVEYFLFPRVTEQVEYNDRRESMEWDVNWLFGATLSYNLGGSFSVSPYIPDTKSIEILRIFTYGAVKYNGIWRMCIVYC